MVNKVMLKHRINHQRYDVLICRIVKVSLPPSTRPTRYTKLCIITFFSTQTRSLMTIQSVWNKCLLCLVEKPASVSCSWPPVWTTTHSLLVNPDFLFQHMASWHPKLILSLFLTCITFRTDIELPTHNAGAKKRLLPLF